MRGRLGCTEPALVTPASPAHVYLPVSLPGLRLARETAALPHTPFPPNPSCLQVPSPRALFSLILCPLPRPSGHGGAGGLALRRVCFQGSAALTVQPSLRAALVSPAGREGQRQGLQSPPRSPVPQRLDSLPGTSKSPHPRAAGGCRGVEAARLPSQLCSPDCSSLGTAAPWSDY